MSITAPWLVRRLAFFTTSALLVSSVSLAAKADDLADAQARYRQDMAACNDGRSNQDVAACRLEARNALAEAKRGRLNDSPSAQYQQNALRRCDVHQGDDRSACEARIRGEGHAEGSVEGGGILREIVTVMPGK